MTKICSECQTVNDDGAEFCKNCGVNLIDIKSESSAVKRRISKTAAITVIVFIVFFAWSFHDFITLPKYGYLGVGQALLSSTFVGIFVSVPVFIVGFIIRKIITKDDKGSNAGNIAPSTPKISSTARNESANINPKNSGDILSESVDELVRLYSNNPDGFYSDSPKAEPVKEIGRRLNALGGFNMMLQAHEMFSSRTNILGASRNLEIIWDGIGSWRG